MSTSKNTYGDIVLIGTFSGSRSVSGPALVVEYLRWYRPAASRHFPFNLLASTPAATLSKAGAVLELVGDKLPMTPDRISAAPLAVRSLSGAIAGGLLAAIEQEPPLAGALLGSAAAVASTYCAYYGRTWLGKRLPVPDALLGLAEDALVYGSGLRWLQRKTACFS